MRKHLKQATLAAAALAFAMPGMASAGSAAKEEAAIKKLLEDGCAGFVAKDLDGAMAPYSKSLFTYDIVPPQHSDYEHLRETNRVLIDMVTNTPTCTYRDMVIKVFSKNAAYARYILPWSVELKDGTKIDIEGRGTDILEKVDGKWTITHEHFSLPVNLPSGLAEFKPGVTATPPAPPAPPVAEAAPATPPAKPKKK